MQINNCSSRTNFTSVVPIKIFVDGGLTNNSELIKKSCRQLTSVLCTQPKNKGVNYQLIVKYMLKDFDYKPQNIFKSRANNSKYTASDFIRIIHSKIGSFMVTGKDADKLFVAGKRVGLARSACKSLGHSDTVEFAQARTSYGNLIDDLIKSKKSRLSEGFDTQSKQRFGDKLQLNLYMKSNEKYGTSNFKMKVSDLDFSPADV